MTERLLKLAKRVRKGVKLLDKKIPNWRRTIRDHRNEFDFADGSCCVLGTLEHYNGRMKVLKAKNGITRTAFVGATGALGIVGADYGFDGEVLYGQYVDDTDLDVLDALWRAEIGL